MKRSLFIFRRDLRLEDNRGLIEALKEAEEVVLAFIFTPDQIEKNPFKGDSSLQFMIESLEDLEEEIKKKKGELHLFYGNPEEIVEKCISQIGIEGVFVNADYTPYSIQRDKKIEAICRKHSISFKSSHDLLLHPIEDTLKKDGSPYTVFTPFYHKVSQFEVAKPEKTLRHNYYKEQIPFSVEASIFNKVLPKRKTQLSGGRSAALKILSNMTQFSEYAFVKDFPALDKTTHLSPHIKFNTCSIREIYFALIKNEELIRSLYWRDFFTLIAYYFPYVFEGPFHKKYKLPWKNDEALFHKWCTGTTGFPIVDAGMRELNQTGFMHNRVRMITGSFLVKDLHIDWRLGEKYFAQKLIDYDPAVNNGNWQWVASTGCDAQPYFRIFNPWLQSKKFDPESLYIKKWITESDYPAPCVDHSKEAAVSLKMYTKIREQ